VSRRGGGIQRPDGHFLTIPPGTFLALKGLR
jgi:hypothetical protein